MRYRLLIPFLFVSLVSFSQEKSLTAVEVFTAPQIDGSLNEEVWQLAPVATGFITNAPAYGKPASLKTEVRVLYDNSAIYIGAYLYENPWQIRWQLNLRDQEQGVDVDYFSVFLDTYKDKQNGYQFLVTARNVQTDARLSPGTSTDYMGEYGDLSWDAVWDSKVGIKTDGWVVEMKIPYSAIRFSRKEIQEWGINFQRFIRRDNETSFWNPVDPNESGFVNQFGNLTGLKELSPPLRLSLSPYISGGYRSTPHSGSFSHEFLKTGGMDVKYGISESFTLDASVIPDFGQVVSDNVVNNISPYEIIFQENRPFFTEGTDLFNKAGIFYSRRVGRQPAGYEKVEQFVADNPEYTIVRNPYATQLYNAIKFSGRNKENLGIGIFNAVTQPTKAVLHHQAMNVDSFIITEPLANYNIIVLDKALSGRSSVTFTNTNVMRDGSARDANVTALDLSFFNRRNRYGISLKPRYSIVSGPDGYTGFRNITQFGKISGKLQFSFENDIQSEKYDPNDLGYLSSPNEVSNVGEISYNLIQPAGRLLNQRYTFTGEHISLFKPFSYQQLLFKGEAYWLLRNFWKVTVTLETTPTWYNDYFELQTPGKKLKRAPYYFASINGNSDNRKRLLGTWDLRFAEGPLKDDPYYRLYLSLRYRFGDHFSLEVAYEREYDNGQFGYAFTREINGDPILARRKYAQVSTLVSGIYNFTPRMNVTFRSRHYWNRMLNTNFYNVKDDGYWVDRAFIDNKDVNYNTYNFDLFYTWEFQMGSKIVVGYKNWLNPTYAIDGTKYRRYTQNLSRMISGVKHGNELTVRFIYYLDYQRLRGR